MRKKYLWLRRFFQTAFLGLWIFLFWKTAHHAFGVLAPDLFLAADPLVSIIALVASRTAAVAMWGGAIFVVLTLVFGRFFCGWVCPLGTILDVFGFFWGDREEKRSTAFFKWKRVKYYLLIFLAVSAVFGGQLLFFFDPLVLLFRAIAVGVMPFKEGAVSFLPFFLLLVIIGLTGVTHRFWCRYLCPLGAFYGVFARFSLFRRRREGCDGCKGLDVQECRRVCGMQAAVMKQGAPEECIRCMACEAQCPPGALSFVPTLPLPSTKETVVDLNRRTFVMSMGLGAATGYASANAASSFAGDLSVVRPPMVFDEAIFSALCVRCGRCIRSCPTGTLQPLLLEGGFRGLWTPAVNARINGCKDQCNACSVACPTHAIPDFGPDRKDKWIAKMGLATFEADRCISYAADAKKPCLKCVEVCPNKAILVDFEAKISRPSRVVYDRCIGCGRCETACRGAALGKPAMMLHSTGRGDPVVLVVDPAPVLDKQADAGSKG
jgi:polyferredoxin/ferredoxin-like protein FixX